MTLGPLKALRLALGSTNSSARIHGRGRRGYASKTTDGSSDNTDTDANASTDANANIPHNALPTLHERIHNQQGPFRAWPQDVAHVEQALGCSYADATAVARLAEALARASRLPSTAPDALFSARSVPRVSLCHYIAALAAGLAAHREQQQHHMLINAATDDDQQDRDQDHEEVMALLHAVNLVLHLPGDFTLTFLNAHRLIAVAMALACKAQDLDRAPPTKDWSGICGIPTDELAQLMQLFCQHVDAKPLASSLAAIYRFAYARPRQ